MSYYDANFDRVKNIMHPAQTLVGKIAEAGGNAINKITGDVDAETMRGERYDSQRHDAMVSRKNRDFEKGKGY